MSEKNHSRISILMLIWLVLCVTGFVALAAYSTDAGEQAPAPNKIEVAKPKLMMFIHPKCTCTRASVVELHKLVDGVDTDVDIIAYFVEYNSLENTLEESEHWKKLARHDEIIRKRDPEGTKASKYGALTSGHCVLYDANGKLIYQGGITPSRGHEGKSPGQAKILNHLNRTGNTEYSREAVFGCPTFNH